MSSKRVAMFIHHEVGGAVVAFYNFMKELRQRDYEVDLYRFNRAGERFLPLSELASTTYEHEVCLKGRVESRLPLLREYLNTYRYFQNLRVLDRQSREMARDIDARDYDFTFIHVDKLVKNPHLLRYLTKTTLFYLQEPERRFYDPSCLFTDELDIAAPTDVRHRLQKAWYKPAQELRRRLHRLHSDNNIRRAKNVTVLANSYFSAESILRAYNIQPQVCHLGIDSGRFYSLPLSSRGDFVLTVGSLTPNKGHTFLLKALSQVPQQVRPDFVVVVDATSPTRKESLKAMADMLGVRIQIRERVAEEELTELYSRAKLFVYGSRLEPFGLAPLEAMASGLPVVAVKSGGIRETVVDGHTGLCTDWDHADFARKMVLLLEDVDMWQSMSDAGPAYVAANWTWEQSISRLEEIVRGTCRL